MSDEAPGTQPVPESSSADPSLPLALDAMGGDHAPREVVRGAVEYARATGRGVLLVGRSSEVRAALDAAHGQGLPLEIVDAPEVIGFGEKISRRALFGRESSLLVAARLVREGRACATVSAGHTGAMMSIAKVVCGLLPGVDRPALPAPLPRATSGRTVLLDAGANVDCRPEHLRQFAVMGFLYSRSILGVAKPRVALLSIGEEDSKGNDVGLEVARILRETPVNFIGNVEGNDLFYDKADVVVCDGFVGNVALKVAEGLSEAIGGMIRSALKTTVPGWFAAPGMYFVSHNIEKKTDYAEVGGVPLLGLRQVAMVAHGRSSAKAIRNALAAADAAVQRGMVARIAAEVALLHEAEQRLVENTAR